MKNETEEGARLSLDFGKLAKVGACGGCVPVAVQDADSREVLLVAYTNETAMRASFEKRRLVLWSTSRNELWEKGATSGARYDLVEARVNCEQNSLVYLVRPVPVSGGSPLGMCHTKNSDGVPRRGCYYRRIDMKTLALEPLEP